MRIVKNIEESTVNFESIKIGDVFLDEDENVCVKIPMVYHNFSGMEIKSLLEGCMSVDDFCQHRVNAYDLKFNKFFWYDDDEQVKLLKATMEVK